MTLEKERMVKRITVYVVQGIGSVPFIAGLIFGVSKIITGNASVLWTLLLACVFFFCVFWLDRLNTSAKRTLAGIDEEYIKKVSDRSMAQFKKSIREHCLYPKDRD